MRPILGAALLLALAACGPKETAEAPPADAPAAPKAPPVSATGVPLWALPLTAEGWGDIKMGISHEAAVAALGGQVQPDPSVKDKDWEACHIIQAQNPDGLWVMVEEGKVTRVTVEPRAAEIATDAGIRVGNPADRVIGSYPKGLTREPHKYETAPAEYLTWWSKPEVAGIRYSIGGDGKVNSISVGTKSIRYVEGCS